MLGTCDICRIHASTGRAIVRSIGQAFARKTLPVVKIFAIYGKIYRIYDDLKYGLIGLIITS
jgi:hypothetical protein